MSTEFINDQWRLPNEENKSKVSNYSMDFLTTTRIPDITGLGLGTSVDTFSISLWFNKSNMNYGIVFSTYSGTGSYITSGVAINLYTDGTIGLYNGAARTTTSAQYSINTWYNLVVTSDGTTVKMYVNGSQVTLNSTTAVARDFTNVWINSAKYSASNFGIVGKIDGVAIFDYALSSSQITTLYGSSSTGIGNPMSLSPKPVAYYPLGDQDAFNGSNYLVPNSSLKDYVFDFDTSRIQVSSQSLGITSQICISAWVKIPDGSTGGASPNIQQIVSEDTTSGTSRNWILSWRGGGYEDFYFAVFHSDGTSTSTYSNVGDINDGNWHHVVGTWDGTTNANAFKIYVDNVATSTTSTKTDIRATSNIPTTIGAIPNAFTRAFDGNISNVQIWDTNLSSTEVETLYNNGSPLQNLNDIPQNSNLQGWWKLDASDTYDSSTGNWTIEDHAGSNDGTSSGMTQANLVQSDLSFTSGYSPYALDFDGSNDYIDCGNVTSLNNLSAFSTSTWINYEGTISGASSHMFLSGGSASNKFRFTMFNYIVLTRLDMDIMVVLL